MMARRSDMARIVTKLTCETQGLDQCKAAMRSIGDASHNAHLELSEMLDGGDDLVFQGMAILNWSTSWQGFHGILRVKPAPAMLLFIGALMAALPLRATVTWRDGWPFVYCPPNDDRDCEDDPTPLVPNELVPA
jgi:hypothetical protein